MARMNNGYIGPDKRNVFDGVISLNKQALSSLILDKISNTNLAGAWGLRKLRTAYSDNCVQVRNSSTNALAQIGFSGQDLNTTALATHVGSVNGLTSVLYDQSGNNRHFSQSTNASQPRLSVSGTPEVINSKPAIFLDGSDDSLLAASLIPNLVNNNAFSLFLVMQKTAATEASIINQGKTGSYYHYGIRTDATTNSFRWRNNNNDYVFGSNTNTLAQLQIISVISSGGTTEMFRNGTSIGTTANGITAASFVSGDEFSLGKTAGSAANFFQGRIATLIIFTRALSTIERQLLEADASTYYAISLA